MTRKKENRKKVKTNSFTIQKSDKIYEFISGKYKHPFFVGLLIIIILILFFKIAFMGYVPAAHDTKQWRSSAQAIYDYNKTHKDQAFWDTNIFSGMPSIFINFSPKYPYINSIRKLTDKIINWRILLMITGALGIYILMIFWKFEPVYAFLAALAFALSSNFLGLLEIGHNTKFRAIIYIPWIFWALELLIKKKNLFSAGLLAMFLIGQFRESHPQISYYTILLMGIWWILNLIWAMQDKKIKNFALFSVLLILVFLLVGMAILNPYMNKMEYTKYSMRGGSKGLDKDYATSWSFHPLEILTFINPGFFGEVSPYYWGWMPFTQTSSYMGIIIFFLAILSIIYIKDRRITMLTVFSLTVLILSFGRHFSLLTNFLLDYFPGYNKFRVPATILVFLQFTVVVLAAFAFKFILEKQNDKKMIKHFKNYLIGAIALFILMLILPALMSHGFIKSGETTQYSKRTIQTLILKRKEIFTADGLKSASLLILFVGLSLLFIKGKLKKSLFITISLILIFFDIISFDSKFLTNLEPSKKDSTYLTKTDLDKFLLKDKEIFRIYPLGSDFQDNKWTYYHQSIGGYHGAKLKRYNDIIHKCLNSQKYDRRIPINWNIVNMLNVKYLIFDNNLPLPNLKKVFYDETEKKYVMENLNHLPRAWFVKRLIKITDKNKLLDTLNSKKFNPATEAIVENNIAGFRFKNGIARISDSLSTVKLTHFDANRLEFVTKTDTTGFLVVSEIYYPAGWKAFIDGKETRIYPVNYILRGLVIPKGNHKIVMQFSSETYDKSGLLSLIGILLSLIFVGIGIFNYILKRRKL